MSLLRLHRAPITQFGINDFGLEDASAKREQAVGQHGNHSRVATICSVVFEKPHICANKLAVIMLAMWRDNLPFCHREEVYRNLKARALTA